MIEDSRLSIDNDIYAITNKAHPEIISLINKGLKKISKEEIVAIEKSWLVYPSSTFFWEGSGVMPQKTATTKDYAVSWEKYLLFLLIGLLALYYLWRMKRQQNRAEVLALTDELTKLPNRRAFNQACKKQKRDQNAIALLFVDVDYFKAYNDHYGHLEGDRVLGQIADILKAF